MREIKFRAWDGERMFQVVGIATSPYTPIVSITYMELKGSKCVFIE
jgi:hypothetical protein